MGRTENAFSSDSRFVMGWDAKVQGFFWVAGLGGHGVTTSAAVGALAAELVLLPDLAKNQTIFLPSDFLFNQLYHPCGSVDDRVGFGRDRCICHS